jgi:protocatechuate 3,4-dioxygenase, beta subunit
MTMQWLSVPTRRGFILGSATAAGLGAFGLGSGLTRACPKIAGDHAASTGRIAPADEPGEAMEIHGTVYAADGVTPAAGVVLYAYHTGVDGLYRPRDRPGPPRLRGWFKTDADGHYAYRTIRPAAYPERKWAAHVHTQLWSATVPAQWGSTLLFADDPLVADAERQESAALGRFANLQPLRRGPGGVWRGVHDIRLKTTGDHFEDNTRHGLQG